MELCKEYPQLMASSIPSLPYQIIEKIPCHISLFQNISVCSRTWHFTCTITL